MGQPSVYSSESPCFKSGKVSDLEKECPEDFDSKDENKKWVRTMNWVMKHGMNDSNWQYKTESTDARRKVRKLFKKVLSSNSLNKRSRLRIGSWMLSIMLEKAPD